MQNSEQEIIEGKIIDLILSEAGPRVVIFKPEIDSFGEDLVIKKRADYEEGVLLKKRGISLKKEKEKKIVKKILLKIISAVNLSAGGDFTKNILKKDLKSSEDFYLIFVNFDDTEQDISSDVWIISSVKFKEIADTEGEYFLFKSVFKSGKKDKYSAFLLDKKEMGNFILKKIEVKPR